jgi:hypothetical protein
MLARSGAFPTSGDYAYEVKCLFLGTDMTVCAFCLFAGMRESAFGG